MSIPNYQEFMLPTLKFLSDGLEHKSRDIVDGVANLLGITDDEKQEMLPSKTQYTYYNRGMWAITYLRKAGLLSYPEKGFTKITDAGKAVLASNPESVTRKYLMKFDEFKDFQHRKKDKINEQISEIDETEKTPDEMIEDAKGLLSANLEDNLIQKILEKEPIFFERLVAKLLCKMGYGGSENDIIQGYGKSGDGGIDGIIKQDALGLDQVHIQAKRYKKDNIVQVGALRDFCGALYGKKNPKGVFITTSSFTKPAVEYASDNDIIIIDGKKLATLMTEYNVGVQVKEVIEIKKIDIDFFDDEN